MQSGYRRYNEIDTPGCKLILSVKFAVLLLRYNFKCLFKLNFDKGHVGIADIWWFLDFVNNGYRHLGFFKHSKF